MTSTLLPGTRSTGLGVQSGRRATAVLLVALAVTACSPSGGGDDAAADKIAAAESAEAEHTAHWGYDEHDGPARWAALSEDYALCGAGQEQSPVDLGNAQRARAADRLGLDMPAASARIIRQEHVLDALDNGHTIQVNVDAGDTLTIGGTAYDLLQYHFHAPSEHTVGGRHYPMEMHLVHQSKDGALAVVGVLIEEGVHNAAFDAVWSNLPTVPGMEVHIEHVQVDIDDMLPADTTSWRYHGSLTTPPCTEGVRWFVMQTPIELDAGQIQQFRDVFSGNNRPAQPLQGRIVMADTASVD